MSLEPFDAGAAAEPLHDINVTPLVDVMLVLLVIFIITAPLLAGRLAVQLPRADAPTGPAPWAAVELVIGASGDVNLQGEATSTAALARRLARIAHETPDAELQLKADQAVPYARVAEVIALAQQAGLYRLAFVTAPKPSPAR